MERTTRGRSRPIMLLAVLVATAAAVWALGHEVATLLLCGAAIGYGIRMMEEGAPPNG